MTLRGIVKLLFVNYCLASLIFFSSAVGASECAATVAQSAVVFFQLDQSEYNNLSPSNRDADDEILSDFQYYVEQAKSRLEAAHLQVIVTSCDFIRIHMKGLKTTYKRRNLNKCCGIILVRSGAKPKVITDVMTDDEIIKEAHQYFGGVEFNKDGGRHPRGQ